MRHHASVTSLSWIPSEAVTGLNKAMFGTLAHYDSPPPDRIDDLEDLRQGDRFRFANVLSASIQVRDGRIIDSSYTGGGVMGSTTVAVAGNEATFAGVTFPDRQAPVDLTADRAVFVQTVGGHTALPAPRRVSKPPFVQFRAPTVWTSLSLTLDADGRSSFELVGASPFPRHWLYGDDGELAAKAGLADFKDWWRHSFAGHTPWGDEESTAIVTEVETALERELAGTIMRGGAKPTIRKLKPGATLTEQGTAGDEIYLLLDGVLGVEVDREPVAEVGPGAILGERAVLEGGHRTCTLRALTKAKVAVARTDQIDRDALAEVSTKHRRESAT